MTDIRGPVHLVGIGGMHMSAIAQLLMERGVIQVTDNGRLRTVPDLVRKADTGTTESVSCQRVARFVGKEFARINDRVTVYTTFGVRP